jgi:hypothetical protein
MAPHLLESRAQAGTLSRSCRWCWDFDLSEWGVSDMSLDNARPELNPLFAFTLTIAGAIAVGLPMAIVIILICS